MCLVSILAPLLNVTPAAYVVDAVCILNMPVVEPDLAKP